MSDASTVVLRAWKDEQYREALPPEVRERIPPRPNNFEELGDEQLEQAAGGITPALPVVAAVGSAAFGLGIGIQAVDALTDDAGVQGD